MRAELTAAERDRRRRPARRVRRRARSAPRPPASLAGARPGAAPPAAPAAGPPSRCPRCARGLRRPARHRRGLRLPPRRRLRHRLALAPRPPARGDLTCAHACSPPSPRSPRHCSCRPPRSRSTAPSRRGRLAVVTNVAPHSPGRTSRTRSATRSSAATATAAAARRSSGRRATSPGRHGFNDYDRRTPPADGTYCYYVQAFDITASTTADSNLVERRLRHARPPARCSALRAAHGHASPCTGRATDRPVGPGRHGVSSGSARARARARGDVRPATRHAGDVRRVVRHDGARWTATAYYDFQCVATDAAGNADDDSTVADVRVDNTPPGVTLTGVGAGTNVHGTLIASSRPTSSSGVASVPSCWFGSRGAAVPASLGDARRRGRTTRRSTRRASRTAPTTSRRWRPTPSATRPTSRRRRTRRRQHGAERAR